MWAASRSRTSWSRQTAHRSLYAGRTTPRKRAWCMRVAHLADDVTPLDRILDRDGLALVERADELPEETTTARAASSSATT